MVKEKAVVKKQDTNQGFKKKRYAYLMEEV